MDNADALAAQMLDRLERLVDDVQAAADEAGFGWIDIEDALCSDQLASRSKTLRAASSLLLAAIDERTPDDRPPVWQAGLDIARMGDLNEAQTFVDQLDTALATETDRAAIADLTHGSNILRGWLARRDGRNDDAVAHLKSAGRVDGSPLLVIGGPDMTLALALLEAGFNDAVLDYLRSISRFWPA
ncbi:MAG: hypothetical protein R2755_33150 [Acidimicrobiales bacterium]